MDWCCILHGWGEGDGLVLYSPWLGGGGMDWCCILHGWGGGGMDCQNPGINWPAQTVVVLRDPAGHWGPASGQVIRLQREELQETCLNGINMESEHGTRST